MDLPTDIAIEFENELRKLEEENKMPYVTSIEQRGIEKGLEKGREEGLEKGREEGLEKGREEGLEKGPSRGSNPVASATAWPSRGRHVRVIIASTS